MLVCNWHMHVKHIVTKLACAWSMQCLERSKVSQGNLRELNLNFAHYSVMALKPTENSYSIIITRTMSFSKQNFATKVSNQNL